MSKSSKKLIRGLEEKYLENFEDSEWYEFYSTKKDELFLGIRNNYVNIYYCGMNMAKISGTFTKASIHKKYLGTIKADGKGDYKSISFENFKTNYETIKQNLQKNVVTNNKIERKVQQELIIRNNIENKNPKWICIDMEYSKQRKNKEDGENSGRFDIIAVSIEKPHKVVLIELKVGNGAISGESGLLKHAEDWEKFMGLKENYENRFFNENREDYLLKEIVEIINNKCHLDKNYPIKKCSEEDFYKEPEFKFLICSGDKSIADIKIDVAKYLWNKEKARTFGVKTRVSTNNIEEKLKYDITEKNNGKLYCEFIFAKGEGKEIKDIINDEHYENLK